MRTDATRVVNAPRRLGTLLGCGGRLAQQAVDVHRRLVHRGLEGVLGPHSHAEWTRPLCGCPRRSSNCSWWGWRSGNPNSLAAANVDSRGSAEVRHASLYTLSNCASQLILLLVECNHLAPEDLRLLWFIH